MLSAMSEATRTAMLAAPSCAAELKAIGFNYDSHSAQAAAGGSEQPAITADAVKNIERLASTQAARMARGGIAAPVVPTRAQQRRHNQRPLDRRDVRRISTQTVLAFLHHNVLLLLMAGHLWAARPALSALLAEATAGRAAVVPRLRAALGVLRNPKVWLWLLAGYAQAAAQVLSLLFRGGMTCLGFAAAYLFDRNVLDRNVGLCMIVGGAGYGVAQFVLNLLPGPAAAARGGYASLRNAVRSDTRTVTAFGVAVLFANLPWPRPWRRRARGRERRGGAAARGGNAGPQPAAGAVA